MTKPQKQRGGKRDGAGRKPNGIESKTIRIPSRYEPAVRELIAFLNETRGKSSSVASFNQRDLDDKLLKLEFRHKRY